jgi:hypothetical protein
MNWRLGLFIAVLTLCATPGAQIAVKQTAAVNPDVLMHDVRTLSAPEFEGRRTGSPGHAKARAWILEQFQKIGLKPLANALEVAFKVTPRPTASGKADSVTGDGVNLVGLCRGSGAKDNGVMVISAHYDHLGIRDGVLYPGADDNASGVAVVLELARRCVVSPWSHDALFVAFDAEEQGLQGARAFVAAPPFAKERLALNVNLDMVSRSASRELYVAGTHHYPFLKPILEPIAARAPFKLLFGHDRPTAKALDDWTMLSDHGAFHAAKIPFVYFGVEDHPDYHKPTDTADKIDRIFFAQVAATVFDAVTALDRALPLPR